MTQAASLPASDTSATNAVTPLGDLATSRRAFAEQGYLVLRGIVAKRELATLRDRVLEEYERAKRRGELFDGGGGISGHLNCFPGEESRFIYEALKEKGVIDLMRALFPKLVGTPNVGCNLNLPGSVTQHYHADSAFQDDFIIANIAVVDTDLVNGAIDVLPGTQKRFYKYWRFAVERKSRLTTRVPLAQGDVLIRTSTLWHRGMPNRALVPRPMAALTWEKGGREDDGFKIDDGKITFHPNWYRPNLLGRLRERTFVRAPITYDAWRFARSLVGNKGDAGF